MNVSFNTLIMRQLEISFRNMLCQVYFIFTSSSITPHQIHPQSNVLHLISTVTYIKHWSVPLSFSWRRRQKRRSHHGHDDHLDKEDHFSHGNHGDHGDRDDHDDHDSQYDHDDHDDQADHGNNNNRDDCYANEDEANHDDQVHLILSLRLPSVTY